LARLSPDRAVLEAPFLGINTRSLIVLAQARGVLLAGLARRAVAIDEYSPAEVKSAVTGNGRADKQQVARMVHILLGAREAGWSADATDALAAALCGAQRLRLDNLRRER
jgi:crossover junction endodeoxyribonuclease RuvC